MQKAHPGPVRYNQLIIVLHWLMLVIIIGVYAAIELREFFPRGSEARDLIKSWHFTLGLSVLFLVLLRLAIRIATPTPAVVPKPSQLQAAIARLVHVALYAFMLAMPIGGWLMLSGEGKPIPFWLGIELPMLIPRNEAIAETIEELHETVGKVGYALIAVHAAAALVHHYVLRDNTLQRILPQRKRI